MSETLTLAPNSLEARDLRSMLHGFTDLDTLRNRGPVLISHGHGIYIEDIHGKRYLEGNSGLWNVAVGFHHQGLIEAACDQMRKFPAYHNLFGRVNEEAVALSEKLLEVAPCAYEQSVLYKLRIRGKRHSRKDALDDWQITRHSRTSEDHFAP